MSSVVEAEIICVRQLTNSDLGWFAVHRPHVRSKQRALNVNAWIAQLLLSRRAWTSGGVGLPCRCIYPGAEHFEIRDFAKIAKNWRLGGASLKGSVLSDVTGGDFAVLCSPQGNDGDKPVLLNFVSVRQDRAKHEWLSALVKNELADSMTAFTTEDPNFTEVAERLFHRAKVPINVPIRTVGTSAPVKRTRSIPAIPPIPAGRADEDRAHQLSVRDKVRSTHILSQMLKVSGDLSAEAQLEFMQVLELLAEQLRRALIAAGALKKVDRDHRGLWRSVSGSRIAFVDGGVANLNMLGAAPIAVRVGGYIVKPGDRGDEREEFVMVKHLIDELYSPDRNAGVFSTLFPDPSALRDAARISVEAAGGVQLISQNPELSCVFLHGALINPVSRYTDLMEGGQVASPFPNFSSKALQILLPSGEQNRDDKDANFVRVYKRQLEILEQSEALVCGVVERESQATSVYREYVEYLAQHPAVPGVLPKAPDDWADWFVRIADQFRVTDALLFRCVLKPAEFITPVAIDRNDVRRAPEDWKKDISAYPKPWVSYLLPSEWGAPIRVEVFEKARIRFDDLAKLVMHCAWLLPRYAFPVGLDIVDKYAKVPNWMSRPVNTNTAVQALRRALESGDTSTFDAMRRLLCGSTRDWLYRPKAF